MPGATAPVKAFMDKGEDFIVAETLADLVAGMNKLTDEKLLNLADIERQIRARDREIDHFDPKNGPLIAVRLNIVSRKTLGGLQTYLSGRVLSASGEVISGLYAAGEASGFGGGGIHGYRALEGTFLGGCLFTGRIACRAIVADLG